MNWAIQTSSRRTSACNYQSFYLRELSIWEWSIPISKWLKCLLLWIWGNSGPYSSSSCSVSSASLCHHSTSFCSTLRLMQIRTINQVQWSSRTRHLIRSKSSQKQHQQVPELPLSSFRPSLHNFQAMTVQALSSRPLHPRHKQGEASWWRKTS